MNFLGICMIVFLLWKFLYITFSKCCGDFKIMLFNFTYTFIFILILLPIVYFLGKSTIGAKDDSEGVSLILFRIMVFVVAGVAIPLALYVFLLQPVAHAFGFDASDWSSRSGKDRIYITEVRSGTGVALIVWGSFIVFLISRYLKKNPLQDRTV